MSNTLECLKKFSEPRQGGVCEIKTIHLFCQISRSGCFSAALIDKAATGEVSSELAVHMRRNLCGEHQGNNEIESCCCCLCVDRSGMSDVFHGGMLEKFAATKSSIAEPVDNSNYKAFRFQTGTAADNIYADFRAEKDGRPVLLHSAEGLNKCNAITTLEKDVEKDQSIVPAVQFKEFLTSGHQGDGVSTMVQEPVGVAASSNGTVAVADLANDLIKVFSKRGKLVRELDHYEKQNGKDVCLLCPTGLAFDNSGNIVVVERGRHRVTVMTPDGKLLRGFGRRGKANGQLWFPHGVSVDSHNRILVTDTANSRVQVFDSEGMLLLVFGDNCHCNLDYPCYALYHKDFFYVSDTDNDCVKVFDSAGKFLRNFTEPGQFSAPSGLAVFRDKYLLVCDYNNDCVKVCTLDGEYVTKFGTSGKETGQFCGPEAVAVLPSGEIVVTDKKNGRVHVFTQN